MAIFKCELEKICCIWNSSYLNVRGITDFDLPYIWKINFTHNRFHLGYNTETCHKYDKFQSCERSYLGCSSHTGMLKKKEQTNINCPHCCEYYTNHHSDTLDCYNFVSPLTTTTILARFSFETVHVLTTLTPTCVICHLSPVSWLSLHFWLSCPTIR